MTTEDLQQAEEGILSALQDSGKAPITVIDDLTRQGIPEDAVRSGIWDLMDRGEVELTSDRQLQVRQPD